MLIHSWLISASGHILCIASLLLDDALILFPTTWYALFFNVTFRYAVLYRYEKKRINHRNSLCSICVGLTLVKVNLYFNDYVNFTETIIIIVVKKSVGALFNICDNNNISVVSVTAL